MYWLRHEEVSYKTNASDDRLRQLATSMNIKLSDTVFQKASQQIELASSDGDIEMWIVKICFSCHPHFLWNFMLDAVSLAKTDEHLGKIATSFAEHILAYYGSMVDDFEEMASADEKFKRMLTGAWRHGMSDNVWRRLRIIQSEVPNPLTCMIPLENGVEYMTDSLSPEKRTNADKGIYLRDADGDWQKVRRL